MKKLFIKLAKKLGFEIIDQNNFYSPTLDKKLNENLSIFNEKSIVLSENKSDILKKIGRDNGLPVNELIKRRKKTTLVTDQKI